MSEPIETPVAKKNGGILKDATPANSLADAEMLAAYGIRNNTQGVLAAVEGIAEAREAFEQAILWTTPRRSSTPTSRPRLHGLRR